MKKRIEVKKLVLRRETLANLLGGYLQYTYQDTVYSRSDCAPLSARCPSADTNCTACIA
ncbi:MAG: hypothetical protein ABIS20_18295 [Thermoanaerobaculia bacterium]